MSSDEDPLCPPKNEQGIDLSKLSPQELRIYRMYGKLPTTQQILSSKFQDKKYFDSGDYAMQNQKGGQKSNFGGIPMRHPNAEKVKEIYNRNSIMCFFFTCLINLVFGDLVTCSPLLWP